jgi:PhoH-like ATPase
MVKSNAALDEFRRRGAKSIVMDTSVAIHDPTSINKFQRGNVVVLPWSLIEELDNQKSAVGLVGFNARQAIKQVEIYNKLGSLHEGVRTKDGGLVLVEHGTLSFRDLPQGTAKDKRDNLILATGKMWREKRGFVETRIVSKDTNLRIKASVLGLKAEDYWDDKIHVPFSELYKGSIGFELPEKEMKELLTSFYNKDGDRTVSAEFLKGKVDLAELYPNQCCYFRAADKSDRQLSALAIYKQDEDGETGCFVLVEKPSKTPKKIGPKNYEQAFAYALLCDPEISLVTISGVAGTGKTLISLLAANDLLDDERSSYGKISVFRPVVGVGKEMGFLPGSLDDKFDPWTIPVFDCLSLIGDGELAGKKFDYAITSKTKGAEQKRGNFSRADELIKAGLLEISPLTFMRGRSLHHGFVIVDDSQNLTPHEAKTIITRAGMGTKFVLTGDPEQIDNRFLDESSNGFSHVIDKFKGARRYGHITLMKTERSELAELAATRL